MGRVLTAASLLIAWLVLPPAHAGAWSGGPGLDVTDLTPNCSVCHSSVGKEQLRTVPEGFANATVFENKHYKAIEAGTGAYQSMAPADREKLLADVKAMDQNASVALTVAQSAKPGQEIQITATVRGGNGLMGVFLVDTDLRYQSRPIQGDGWMIVGPPRIWGGDGKEQTRWVERRAAGLKKNVNSAVIYDQKTDLGAGKFAEGKVTWTVRAPQEPGSYSVTVAFNYGTEKSSPVGAVTTPSGAVLPRGGAFGSSGRIMFSRPVTVTVR